jgi:hypothetical protein
MILQATAFSQTLVAWHVGLAAAQGSLTHAVPLSTAAGAYDEKYLGDITISKWGTVDWRLTAVTTGPFYDGLCQVSTGTLKSINSLSKYIILLSCIY